MLKLIAYATLQDEQLSLAMAEAVLAEHIERCDPMVHVTDIEAAVGAYFGVTPANLHSAKKGRTVSLARHFSMYLTRKHTSMSSSEVGRYMGNKNHATVLVACKKIEEMLQRDAEINWEGPHGNKIAKACHPGPSQHRPLIPARREGALDTEKRLRQRLTSVRVADSRPAAAAFRVIDPAVAVDWRMAKPLPW